MEDKKAIAILMNLLKKRSLSAAEKEAVASAILAGLPCLKVK